VAFFLGAALAFLDAGFLALETAFLGAAFFLVVAFLAAGFLASRQHSWGGGFFVPLGFFAAISHGCPSSHSSPVLLPPEVHHPDLRVLREQWGERGGGDWGGG